MEKILIVGCKNGMDDVCVGCTRCIVAFNRREGHFSRYDGEDASLLGIVSCGGCPGSAVIGKLVLWREWNAFLGEEPTKIHVAPCLKQCPYSETIAGRIGSKVDLEIVEGTHPYMSETVFPTPPGSGRAA
jgi:predicted metal-binding protein